MTACGLVRVVEQELEAMKNKVKEMEDEAEKLRKIQEQVEEGLAEEGDETAEADRQSVYVGQVDYSATPEELQEHFAACGTVNRVTILCDQFRNPKGYAYIEFDSPEAVEAAVALNESEFKGRQIKVRAPRARARRRTDHVCSRARASMMPLRGAGGGEAHQRARLRAWARTRTRRRLREGQGREGQGQGRVQGWLQGRL